MCSFIYCMCMNAKQERDNTGNACRYLEHEIHAFSIYSKQRGNNSKIELNDWFYFLSPQNSRNHILLKYHFTSIIGCVLSEALRYNSEMKIFMLGLSWKINQILEIIAQLLMPFRTTFINIFILSKRLEAPVMRKHGQDNQIAELSMSVRKKALKLEITLKSPISFL